jgi:hypothetical protein
LAALCVLLTLLVWQDAAQARTSCPGVASWDGRMVSAWTQPTAATPMAATTELSQDLALSAERTTPLLDSGGDDPKDPPGDLVAELVVPMPPVGADRPAQWRPWRLAVHAPRSLLRPPDA